MVLNRQINQHMKSIDQISWETIYESMNGRGYACIPQMLSPAECEALITLYEESSLYRNVIHMQRYRFGKGEYKYFSYPLPPLVQMLRERFYEPLSMLANAWMYKLGLELPAYPAKHAEFIAHCHQHNQNRPTPLILQYEAGGFNTLHQDLYGEVYFPFQVLLVLTQRGKDHEGGEFVLTEQVPRAQSKAQVIVPNQGDAVIFTTRYRPVKGTKGFYRSNFKHGVSEVTSGKRYALGIIFHDAT